MVRCNPGKRGSDPDPRHAETVSGRGLGSVKKIRIPYVLTERLSRRAEAGGAPWVSAAAYIGIQDPYLPEASLRADGGSSSWEASLSALLAELKSAETGVTDEEAARAKRRIRTALESAVKAGIPDPDIAVEGMETELASGRVMTSPETDLVLFDAAASSITGKAISDAIREAFETGAVTIELMAPEKVPESDLLRAYESGEGAGESPSDLRPVQSASPISGFRRFRIHRPSGVRREKLKPG